MPVLKGYAAALAFALCVVQALACRTMASELSEYQIKAAFLVNFTKFIDWPDSAFASATAPLVIGVIGDDPFGRNLDDIVRGSLVAARSIAVKRVEAVDDITHFQVVFISASEKRRLEDILRRLDNSSVVTVSDMDKFCDAGGLIAFVTENNRIRFEVNVDVAHKRNVKISSKLLSLALIHKNGA